MAHHTLIGFCHWDLPALIILLIVVAIFLVRNRKLKKREEELQDQINECTANAELASEAAEKAVPLDEMLSGADAGKKE